MTEYTMTKTQNTFLFDRPKTDKYFYYTQLADVRFHSKKTAEWKISWSFSTFYNVKSKHYPEVYDIIAAQVWYN